MYLKPSYITWDRWNNSFSLEKRQNKKLRVSSIINWNIENIKLGEEIVFEDYDFDWNLKSCKWLNNFYKIPWQGKEIILFDNHNHAFYFWLEAYNKWKISKWCTLIHIDEHSDMRDPWIYPKEEEYLDLKKVFEYTNHTLNVWNYIIPAKKIWIIDEIVQIRNEYNLKEFDINNYKNKKIILNLDLDFFQPELDYISYCLKKKVILDTVKEATLITVASSPFFIDQGLALDIFRDLFEW